ncbi:MAG: hypothetical protein HDR32_02445 [Treponema sp.]|nr:hypothetical protein [Treponema sp.]
MAENVPEQRKRPAFWQKSRQDNQNAPRFDRKHAEATKTPQILAENTLGRTKRPAFWQKMRQDNENVPHFCGKHAGASKTPPGGASPT